MLANMAAGFSDQCSVAVGNAYDTTGTLTKGSLKRLSPTAIAALYSTSGSYHELRDLLKTQIEMKACGTRRNSLYEWVMSSNKPGLSALLTKQGIMRGGSLIQPFILAKQRSVINSDYWYASANSSKATYDATTSPILTGVDSGSRVLGVKSVFGGSGLDLTGQYFLPGKYVYQLSSVSSAATITQWKIVQAGVNSQDSTVVDVEVVQTQKTSGEITSSTTSAAGLLIAGPNNIHDVEAWCRNMVSTVDTKLVPFWLQTMRDARRVDDQYLEVFQKLMADNEYYRTFLDLPTAERNRQDEIRSQKEFLNAFFHGTAISSNQTLASWGSLSAITAASNAYGTSGEGAWTGGQTVGYRANMIGVIPQLHACGRVVDSAETEIDIKTWLETSIYDVYRSRESLGYTTDTIDVGMSATSMINFQTEYISYGKEKTGDIVRINLDGDSGVSEFGFPFQRFRLFKPASVKLAIYTDPYFDDFASAASTASVANIGNRAYTLDIGRSIYPAIVASKRVQHKTGDLADLAKIDATYACRMENPTTSTTLTSKTVTAIVECPLSSRVDHNFTQFKYNAP